MTTAAKGSLPLEKTPIPTKMNNRKSPRRAEDDKRIMMMLRIDSPSSSLRTRFSDASERFGKNDVFAHLIPVQTLLNNVVISVSVSLRNSGKVVSLTRRALPVMV